MLFSISVIKKFGVFYYLSCNFIVYICVIDFTLSKQAYLILGYLAYETVAQIIDLAFIVRQDQEKRNSDAIERQRLHFVNPCTYRPYYHNKVRGHSDEKCLIDIKQQCNNFYCLHLHRILKHDH